MGQEGSAGPRGRLAPFTAGDAAWAAGFPPRTGSKDAAAAGVGSGGGRKPGRPRPPAGAPIGWLVLVRATSSGEYLRPVSPSETGGTWGLGSTVPAGRSNERAAALRLAGCRPLKLRRPIGSRSS